LYYSREEIHNFKEILVKLFSLDNFDFMDNSDFMDEYLFRYLVIRYRNPEFPKFKFFRFLLEYKNELKSFIILLKKWITSTSVVLDYQNGTINYLRRRNMLTNNTWIVDIYGTTEEQRELFKNL
jgi:hypothetical protein